MYIFYSWKNSWHFIDYEKEIKSKYCKVFTQNTCSLCLYSVYKVFFILNLGSFSKLCVKLFGVSIIKTCYILTNCFLWGEQYQFLKIYLLSLLYVSRGESLLINSQYWQVHCCIFMDSIFRIYSLASRYTASSCTDLDNAGFWIGSRKLEMYKFI